MNQCVERCAQRIEIREIYAEIAQAMARKIDAGQSILSAKRWHDPFPYGGVEAPTVK